MKKLKVIIPIYLIIGIIFWVVGYAEAPTFAEGVFTFFYIVTLWPVIILLKVLL